MKTLVLGLGNPLLSDDGVGVRVAEMLRGRLPGVDVFCGSASGLDLIETVRGYGRLILVDALAAKDGGIGEIRRLSLSDLPSSGALHLFSQHDADVATTLEAGKRLGEKMPDEVVVYGVVVEDVRDFREELSPRVEAAAQKAAKLIEKELR